MVEVIKEMPAEKPRQKVAVSPKEDCNPLLCEVQRLRCQLQKCEEVQLENGELRNALHKCKKDMGLIAGEVTRLEAKNEKKNNKIDRLEDEIREFNDRPDEGQIMRQMQFHIDFLTDENKKL